MEQAKPNEVRLTVYFEARWNVINVFERDTGKRIEKEDWRWPFSNGSRIVSIDGNHIYRRTDDDILEPVKGQDMLQYGRFRKEFDYSRVEQSPPS